MNIVRKIRIENSVSQGNLEGETSMVSFKIFYNSFFHVAPETFVEYPRDFVENTLVLPDGLSGSWKCLPTL